LIDEPAGDPSCEYAMPSITVRLEAFTQLAETACECDPLVRRGDEYERQRIACEPHRAIDDVRGELRLTRIGAEAACERAIQRRCRIRPA